MSGLLALLDDIAALVKINAASLDDISTQVAKTGSKVSGIVIDDAAVTPKYVVGLDPKRELAIIFAIAKKSILNKLLYIAPIALLLGFFLPQLIQPILMVGGAYLCFEGYEKLHHIFSKKKHNHEKIEEITADELEKLRIESAVRTDLILSSEIMAITYYNVANEPLTTQIAVMAAIAIGITIAVYGFVGLLVKADDFGLWLARTSNAAVQKIGRIIVRIMPYCLQLLSYVGTAAMLWVGAEIIVHGTPPLHHQIELLEHHFAQNPTLGWICKATSCAVGGVILGGIIANIIPPLIKVKQKLWKN
jgi:predicted DNA repair protein MutK